MFEETCEHVNRVGDGRVFLSSPHAPTKEVTPDDAVLWRRPSMHGRLQAIGRQARRSGVSDAAAMPLRHVQSLLMGEMGSSSGASSLLGSSSDDISTSSSEQNTYQQLNDVSAITINVSPVEGRFRPGAHRRSETKVGRLNISLRRILHCSTSTST